MGLKLLEHKFRVWEELIESKQSIYVSYRYGYCFILKLFNIGRFKDIEVAICGVRRASFTNRSCYTSGGYLNFGESLDKLHS